MPHLGDSDKDYQAESDLRALVEAQKVRADKGRLKAAMAMAKKQMAALKSVEKA